MQEIKEVPQAAFPALSSWPCKTPRDDRASSDHGCPGRRRQSPSWSGEGNLPLTREQRH